MIGTYLLVLFGAGSIVLVAALPSDMALLIVATVFGATVAVMMVLFGARSGAHINPAISLSSALSRTLKANLFLPYVTFQVAGALLAGLSLRLLFSLDTSQLGSTQLSVGTSPLSGFLLEVLGTFVLACSALFVPRVVKNRFVQSLMVGLTLFVLIVLIGPLTGASFNPARSLGPSIFSGYFTDLPIYLAGPLIGGACAGILAASMNKKRRCDDTICLC
jgi:MIP family channel proteins